MTRTRLFLAGLFALLLASRMCHTPVLWEGDALPMAAAGQMLDGKTLYRDIWYDKPPLVPAFHLLCGARPGWELRAADALYALLCCLVAYGFARDLWSRREGVWAAGLLGFFLIFYLPSAAIPAGSDLLMLAPHVAAVWMAYKRRPFWSGALAGVAFWVSPKAVFVAAACALWYPAGVLQMAVGFLAAGGAVAAALWSAGALGAYWEEVWVWGRLYAGGTFLTHPLANGAVRTLNWMGFHIAAVIAAGVFLIRRSESRLRWVGWLALTGLGVAAGLRFFPRYYFLLLPVIVLMAARGFNLMGRSREFVALLLLIPATRFGPAYLTVLTHPEWRDTAMDRDSRAAAELIRGMAHPGDTLFVWGYRPELYVYSRLPAGTMYLDSQPLTGVPADRHLTESTALETVAAREHRARLASSQPTFVADGLTAYNPRLAIEKYPDLREWFSRYREVARTGQTVIYRRAR